MGILGGLAKKAVVHVVKKKATEAAIVGAAVGVKRMEAKGLKKEKEELFTPTENIRLFLRENESWKKGYDIFDQSYKAVYKVKSGKIAKKHLTLCDVEGNEIGHVNAELFTKNEFCISLNNCTLGYLRPVSSGTGGRSWKKIYCETKFNGWLVESNVWGTNYTVTKGKDLIMRFEKTSDIAHNNYMVDIVDKKDEVVALLVVLAMEAKRRS